MISVPLLALAYASQLAVTIADGLPQFDAAPGCRAAQNVMPASFEACMRDEADARTQLAAQWDKFAVSDRATCAQNEKTGGPSSYIELLTCLQMARDARSLPASK